MTSLISTESVSVVDEKKSVFTIKPELNYLNYQRRHVLKTKENTHKHKCNKVLRRKLKKYKLRQNGSEDQDVLDVSKVLVSSLVIKSPNNLKESVESEGDLGDLKDLRPPNYLFKMVRKKAVLKIKESSKISEVEITNQIINIDNPLKIMSQEKKQTNAFKLLMDSRNKSIGTNSPGKEKTDDHLDTEEIVERKNVKAKRHLLLQKMAEAKGSIRNKEILEYQDKIIKRQMEKRAEKLKNMVIKNNIAVKENEVANNSILHNGHEPKIVAEDEAKYIDTNNTKKQTKTLKIVDIFNTIEDPIKKSPDKKYICKEDQEFLKKLSPSLKKKESMLCYFKKLNRDSEVSPVDSENDNLIKVKLQPRNKKRGKKKKLSLRKQPIDNTFDLIEINEENNEVNQRNQNNGNNKIKEDKIIVLKEGHSQMLETTLIKSSPVNHHVIIEDSEVKGERQKRKRNTKVEAFVTDTDNNNALLNNDHRPKRTVKKPVKYIEDAYLSSSDEDLHIFTPKKKKHTETVENDKNSKSVNQQPNMAVDKHIKPNSEKNATRDLVSSKKPAKLASIFTPKQTDAALEARQKFLQSGVPDKLKKIISQQKHNACLDNSFPIVVHVQQIEIIHEIQQPLVTFMDVNDDICPWTYEENAFTKLLHLDDEQSVDNMISKKNIQTLLQNIKELHPKFPVYRTYRYLRGKRKGEFKDCNYLDLDNSIEIMNDVVDVTNDSPDRLNWTDKYKALSTNQIIGNFESIKELRKWLVLWTENELKSKPKSKPVSDSSDYYQSDTDSRDSMKTMNNLLILTGPTGCGKTASVYAVAAELAMKVIEVNASSRRTGKIMLQDLQEATQSYKVNRAAGNSDNSQKTQETKETETINLNKKRGRAKKTIQNNKSKKHLGKSEVLSGTSSSQESTRTDSSLILIDDADIVFDQDDGFSSAIVQLVQCSKRPVILITSTLVCPHLQRFLQNGKILKMCPLLPRILGTWLDIMCLADSGICWPGIGAKLLDYFKGDMRKTINYLQFYIPACVHSVNSGEDMISQNVDFYKSNIDEENSCMSWANNEDSEGRTIVPIVNHTETNAIWMNFVDKHLKFNFAYPVQLYNIWWSIPSLLNTESNNSGTSHNSEDISGKNKSKNEKVNFELDAVANAMDAISLSDYLGHINPDTTSNITSQLWYYPEGHSVSDRENLDYYIKGYEMTNEICHTLVTSSIATAQNVLGCDKRTDITFPGMALYRERDKIVARHKTLTNYLNPSAVLDRRAVALDYWPSCRTICRFEKSKNDTNMKRNNRFCHYLKSLSILCKSDTFDNLCDSLCSNGGINHKF